MEKVRKITRWAIAVFVICLISGIVFYRIGYTNGSNGSIYDKISTQKDEYIDNQNKLKTISNQISDKQSELDNINQQISQKQKDITNLQSTVTASNNNSVVLSAGQYTVGKDINQGIYDLVLVEGSGVVSGKDGLSIVETFGNYNGFITNYKNAELIQGSKIEISGTLKIRLDPVK